MKVSDDAEVLGYKPSTYEVTVESAGSWTLQGSYDWITPSKTSGNGGETITFSTTLNTTGLIRTADYTVVSNGEETPITLYQKSGKLEECFGTGTAAVISPVGKIVDHGKEICFPAGMEKMGPVTQKLYDTLTGIQMGRIPAPEGWICTIK